MIKNILLLILFIDMIQRTYPNHFDNFIINISMNCIYFYSKIQIFLLKTTRKINEIIETNKILLKIKECVIYFIEKKQKNNIKYDFIKNGKKSNFTDFSSTTDKPEFMIFSWLSHDKKCFNKKIIYSNNEYADIAEISDIKFILIEIKFGNKGPYKIDLKTDEYNYYCVGNKLTKDFFIFYLKNHLKINYEINNADTLSITIIDNEINTFNINFTDKNESIIIDKIGYKLLNSNQNEEK